MKRYRTNLRSVPREGGLKAEEGWINMQVQFLIDQKSAGSDKLLVGYTVLPPGARHDKHRHPNVDEFLVILKGHGYVYTDGEDEPSGEGDVIFTPRGHWHGFNNTGTEDVVIVWGWSGAGSLEAAGYEIPPEGYGPPQSGKR
ncbi:MAG: cupin domain-containing protein [Acidobacteriia bacterium]|nr:cupin domain-containing protein [Terriglobia bacterium]